MSLLSARSAAVTMSSDGLPAGSIGSIIAAASLSAASSTAEGGLSWPILQEAAHPGSGVLGAEQTREASSLDLQACRQVRLKPDVDCLLGGGQRDRRAASIGGSHRAGGRVDL